MTNETLAKAQELKNKIELLQNRNKYLYTMLESDMISIRIVGEAEEEDPNNEELTVTRNYTDYFGDIDSRLAIEAVVRHNREEIKKLEDEFKNL